MFPQHLERLGPALPPGWQRPTPALVKEAILHLSEGLAPPSARHLYEVADPLTILAQSDPRVAEGIDMLYAYADANSPSPINAAGMAYPQLARASEGNYRVLALNLGMPTMRAASTGQATVRLVYNPVIEPIESEGWQYRRESCYSAPGIAVVIRRWNAVMVHEWGGESYRLDGNDAWIMQHEVDHLNGVVCVMHAIEQGSKLYFLSPEKETMAAARIFFADLSQGPPQGNWPEMSVSQWEAMVTKVFDLAAYATFLR